MDFTIKEFKKQLKLNLLWSELFIYFTIKEFKKQLKLSCPRSICKIYFTIREFKKRLKQKLKELEKAYQEELDELIKINEVLQKQIRSS